MKNLNTIFEIIDNEQILLEETVFKHSRSEGLYFNIPGIPPTIGVDKSIVTCNYKYISILAEELGHHFTTLGDLIEDCQTYDEELLKNKKEQIAKLWAADFLISDEEFVQALHNCISTIPDMAEYFTVTEEIIKYKILSITLNEFKYNNIRNNFRTREIPYHTCAI
ncbi:ImmA/IrrE family metallo-endopeptidase [Clostridium chromiireducens]|uniref:IrrE N-terminal-like domain-containing protein n=1 Tax=Clostridium chromiireducens TaxID=225345 RepID=A0A1V4IUZ3_9CLOT|nr:ImmA/IrrE family metallo-endopeptidase [Clostridium chromiireducens]OPJ63723.1 hypothetical protein CLCHR_15380 [Clostridium chromiireducens]